MNKKIGLVLAGGGGRGAYQIGAWKAIEECKINISAIAGTSVGALNGALFQQNTLDTGIRMWENIASKNVLSFNIESMPEGIASSLSKFGVKPGIIPNFLRTRGLFSQQGLKNMIDEALEFSKIIGNERPFFVTAYDKAANTVKYFNIKNYDPSEIKKILLASCALPFIFDDIEIGGKIYTDGGWYWGLPGKNLDNTPIKPLYEAGCEVIIAICLSQDNIVDRKNFSGVTVLPIVPLDDMGGVLDGVLDFSNAGAKSRIERGYSDTMKVLSNLNEFISNEKKYAELWNEIEESQKSTRSHIESIDKQNEDAVELKKSIDDFNSLIYNDKFDEVMEVKQITSECMLSRSNVNLLTQIERSEILCRVDDYITRNINNSHDIENIMLDAISCLAPVEGRADGQHGQGIFERLWGAITGKNHKISAMNNKDLAMAQYAAISLIDKMQKKNILSFEFTAALNNHVNWLFYETATLNKKLNEQCFDVYKSLALTFARLRNEIIKDRRKLYELEDRVTQLEWFSRIHVQTYNGTEYRNLTAAEQLICLVNDFYRSEEHTSELQSH